MSYPGVSFTSTATGARVFEQCARAFAELTECDVETKTGEQTVKGFCFCGASEGIASGTERCKFAGELVAKKGRWVVELQRVAGSAVAFNGLVRRLAKAVAAVGDGEVGDVQTTGPFVDAAALFGDDQGPAGSPCGGTGGTGVLDSECRARLLAMAGSQCVDVRREGLKSLASLAASAESRLCLLDDSKDGSKDGSKANGDSDSGHSMVRLLADALASEDDEVRWSGSCLLAGMSQSAAFCGHMGSLVGLLLSLLRGEDSYRTRGLQRNIELAIDRFLEDPRNLAAFRGHAKALDSLARSERVLRWQLVCKA